MLDPEEESLAEVNSSQETQGRDAQDQWSHPFILQGGRRQQSLLCSRLQSQCWINPRSPGFATAKSLQLCLTLRPHRQQPTRFLHPWDFPGKSTGVGCHCLLHPDFETALTPLNPGASTNQTCRWTDTLELTHGKGTQG